MRLTWIEAICIVAIGVATVELPAGHRLSPPLVSPAVAREAAVVYAPLSRATAVLHQNGDAR